MPKNSDLMLMNSGNKMSKMNKILSKYGDEYQKIMNRAGVLYLFFGLLKSLRKPNPAYNTLYLIKMTAWRRP